jgi:hypothetical protein
LVNEMVLPNVLNASAHSTLPLQNTGGVHVDSRLVQWLIATTGHVVIFGQ